MTHSIRAVLALLVCTTLAACATTTPVPASAPAVVLVSIDGFRSDYLDRGLTPNLSKLAAEGVRAEGMRPSYPALTFPNHWALVTGLRPDRNGIVHNVMRDPAIGAFKAGNETNAGDARWWNGAEPIWVTAERAGLRTATMFWPGSQAPVRGVRPTHWRAYDERVPDDARVDQVVQWLASKDDVRLATMYFELLDDSGHGFGPDSPEVARDIAKIDATIGRLVDELQVRGLRERVNLVIVSDHGMAEVAPGHAIAVEDMVDARDATRIANGQVVTFAPVAGREREAEATLLARHDHYACWKKDAMPPQWHYGTHPRVAPIVCQMDEGWDAIERKEIGKRPEHARGSHGFDPALPSMRAVFVANGPAFKAGATLPVIDNVDVYPLLARLLGVAPQPHDGSADTFVPALR
ncbi:ectonucleotide pyrophosphatase/phosphodiesterase [Lysobacter sp. A6]|uniref:Ectonucleotide pyrophosphatase/phosphodiesterase n=1 Tax=Noviluteimonas lactosilytica TaxID=2888523 RepID=A0ABS8JFI2_9GAMM|nr:ectonucleotide pyrophosphatase/phosphodiesterase [Lysobacter lactosilyticus]MCC8362248.1 ectonucleotide pyrophosphatase/phosphodiesterase [Lysobacter lactosilyticus]